jgi:hypothetical protein
MDILNLSANYFREQVNAIFSGSGELLRKTQAGKLTFQVSLNPKFVLIFMQTDNQFILILRKTGAN